MHRLKSEYSVPTRIKRLIATFRVGPDRKFCKDGDFRIGGVKGTSSQIKVAFVDPARSMTGALLLTGNRQEQINILIPGIEPFTVTMSLIDPQTPLSSLILRLCLELGTNFPAMIRPHSRSPKSFAARGLSKLVLLETLCQQNSYEGLQRLPICHRQRSAHQEALR